MEEVRYSPKEVNKIISYAFVISEFLVVNDLFDSLIDIDLAVNQCCTWEQKEFVELWCKGYSNNDLAQTFEISENAIRQKKKRICNKVAKYLNGEL